MKLFTKRVLAAIIALILSLTATSLASALSIYNVNGDTDASGKSIVDICDYVRAKKLAVGGNGTYNKEFFRILRRIIMGLEDLPPENNGGSGGSIYLPEVP